MHPSEAKLMRLMKEKQKAKASDLSQSLGIGKDIIGRLAYSLSKKNLLTIEKVKTRTSRLTSEGKDVLKNGLIEKKLLKKLPIEPNKLQGSEKIALNWALKRGWAEVKEGKVVRIVEKTPTTNEEIWLKNFKKLSHEDSKLKVLKKRKWISFKEDFDYIICLTEAGGVKEIEEQITQMTPAMLVNGKWKEKKFKAFSPNTPVPQIYAGRFHPLNEIIQKIRRVFLEMGFTEVEGKHIESTFWDFDALFVPQDHPAREMQDTFYMKGKQELPELAKSVADIHKKSWGSWSKREAQRQVLRTHMTSVSAHALSKAKPPAKIFTIGKVFRNETVDYKHLAEFHQVDGIVFDENVNFNNLVGYLKDFFRKLGFKKIRIRPAYFPYTEMSAEVDVWLEEKGTWFELGGSGIFRPEVVKPLTGVDVPVLAWGLGIERIAMLYYGLKDIRELYKSNINWLRNREVFL